MSLFVFAEALEKEYAACNGRGKVSRHFAKVIEKLREKAAAVVQGFVYLKVVKSRDNYYDGKNSERNRCLDPAFFGNFIHVNLLLTMVN